MRLFGNGRSWSLGIPGHLEHRLEIIVAEILLPGLGNDPRGVRFTRELLKGIEGTWGVINIDRRRSRGLGNIGLLLCSLRLIFLLNLLSDLRGRCWLWLYLLAS